VFRGVSSLTMDAKGRVAMPVKYCGELFERAEGKLIVTIDAMQNCLAIYPLDEWQEVECKLCNLPSLNEQASRLQRILISNASDVVLDSAKRILIPSYLRKYADLGKDVILAGQLNRFQLWNEVCWSKTIENDLVEVKNSASWPEELKGISL